jgi:hypothetical protein
VSDPYVRIKTKKGKLMYIVEVIKKGIGVVETFGSRSRAEAVAQKNVWEFMYPEHVVMMEWCN